MVVDDPSLLVAAKADPLPRKRSNARGRGQAEATNTNEPSTGSSSQVASRELPQEEQQDDDADATPTLSVETDNEAEWLAEIAESTSALVSLARAESEEAVAQLLGRTPSPSPAPEPDEDDLVGILPLELWIDIAENLDRKELCVTSLLCRKMEFHCRQPLYRAILHKAGGQMPQAVAQALFVHLVRRPDLAVRVRVFNGDDVDMPVPSDGVFFRALSGMHNLRVLAIGPGLPDRRFRMTLPKLEALDIPYDHSDDFVTDIGPGDDLKFLRCSYEVACDILENETSRQLAADSLLQLHVPRMRIEEEIPIAFFDALVTTQHPPGMIDMDRFVLRQLAVSARSNPPSQNSIRHLRVHINATGDSSDPHSEVSVVRGA